MNLIDYNQAIEALEKERQYLLNREQYGAEHVLIHHALNVIAELPIIRQPAIVRCKDCQNVECEGVEGFLVCDLSGFSHPPEFFCADGERKDT